MPVLCFGGSFNPIHNGHLRCAQAVAATQGYEQILLIPSAQPPHKPDSADLASAADRLAMCRLATAGSALFEVDDIEMRREGASFTLDTGRELKARGIDPIHWLIGADMLMYLPRWHRPLDLLAEVHFVVMARPGWRIDWSKLPQEFQRLRGHVVGVPQIDISATEIRRRVAAGEPIDQMVPPAVAHYIAQRRLYVR